MKTLVELPPSVLTKHQVKTFIASGPARVRGYGPSAEITATVRYDDQCGNGHNTFSITGAITTPASRRRNDIEAGGQICEDIVYAFPHLAPFMKWHLCSSDFPLHYIANTIYHAGDRDCWGMRKGEFRQHTSRGPNQNGGVEGVPNWVLELPERTTRDIYATEKPAPVVCEWKAYGRTGEGKARDFAAARSCAIWPEVTDGQLGAESDELRAMLMARHPALMAEFRAAVESLGFIY